MRVREMENLNRPVTEPQRQEYFISILNDAVHTRTVESGKKPTYHIITFGCQMNARDSENIVVILNYICYEEKDSYDSYILLFNKFTL